MQLEIKSADEGYACFASHCTYNWPKGGIQELYTQDALAKDDKSQQE